MLRWIYCNVLRLSLPRLLFFSLPLSPTATALRVQWARRGPAGAPEVWVIRERLRWVLPGQRPVLLLGRTDLLQILPQQQEVENGGGTHRSSLTMRQSFCPNISFYWWPVMRSDQQMLFFPSYTTDRTHRISLDVCKQRFKIQFTRHVYIFEAVSLWRVLKKIGRDKVRRPLQFVLKVLCDLCRHGNKNEHMVTLWNVIVWLVSEIMNDPLQPP